MFGVFFFIVHYGTTCKGVRKRHPPPLENVSFRSGTVIARSVLVSKGEAAVVVVAFSAPLVYHGSRRKRRRRGGEERMVPRFLSFQSPALFLLFFFWTGIQFPSGFPFFLFFPGAFAYLQDEKETSLHLVTGTIYHSFVFQPPPFPLRSQKPLLSNLHSAPFPLPRKQEHNQFKDLRRGTKPSISVETKLFRV